MKKLDLVAVGACNLDLIAKVNEIPKKDGEVSISQFEMKVGGSAANVARMVSKLGHSSGFVGAVGEDRFGDFLLEKLGKQGVDISQVKRIAKSGMAIGMVRGKDRYLYTYGGSALDYYPEDIPEAYLGGAKLIHLTSIDSPKGIEVIKRASAIAKKSGAKVIFDPGHIFMDRGLGAIKPILKKTYGFLPSESEIRKLIDKSLWEAGKAFLPLGPEVVLITRGEKGCYLISREFQEEIPPCKVDTIKDSLGAGDAFAAGFISALLQEKDLSGAARFANYIACTSLSHIGAEI